MKSILYKAVKQTLMATVLYTGIIYFWQDGMSIWQPAVFAGIVFSMNFGFEYLGSRKSG